MLEKQIYRFHVGKINLFIFNLKGGIIMLKKVMIICLAFSFVFIGGIAFAQGEGPTPLGTDEPGTEITTEKDEIEVKGDVEEGVKEEAEEGEEKVEEEVVEEGSQN
jgi:hypothetical protein